MAKSLCFGIVVVVVLCEELSFISVPALLTASKGQKHNLTMQTSQTSQGALGCGCERWPAWVRFDRLKRKRGEPGHGSVAPWRRPSLQRAVPVHPSWPAGLLSVYPGWI